MISLFDKMHFYKSLLVVLGGGFPAGCAVSPVPTKNNALNPAVAANYVVTNADDFIVDVYQNGKVVPDSRRHLLSETFGATCERVDLQVRRGDWLVFHVVNDRFRWGGCSYFAAAGLFEKNEFGFVSDASSGNWSSCDDPACSGNFIIKKHFMSDNRARKIANPWGDGPGIMKQHAGDSWSGEAIWGNSADTWLKFIVP